jgi:hypothetical protein
VYEDDVGEEAAWLIVKDGLIVGRCVVLSCSALHCFAALGCMFFVFLCCVRVRLSEGKGCGCGHGWNGIEIPFALFIEFLCASVYLPGINHIRIQLR